ncbi:MAG: hypothetical protein NE330_08285, partial [Lentisphaeraceae bacterium]|nr:hypothetical protein [Lentisphaeraceae bacterium]
MTDEEFEDLLEASLARDSMLDFMKYCWIRPNAPLLIGSHTREICAEIDKALADYREYKSSYLHIVVPFRHGKSDISSRYLVAFFLGHFPDDEVIQAAYGATLSEGFSKDVKKIMESEEYKKVFPGVVFDKG